MSDLELNKQRAISRRLQKFSDRVFDLEHAPLFRAELLRVADDEHIAMFCLHHMISDGWSTGILSRELSAIYNSLVNGGECSLDPLPIQYGDFAQWQRALAEEKYSQDLSFWKQQLAGMETTLEIPADGKRPASSSRAERREWDLQELTVQLRAMARQHGVTTFMVVLAVFKLLLARYTGQEDISVGSPIANRNRADLENLVGFFVNTLVLRGRLDGNPSFTDLLARTREVCLGAYAHQDIPFEKLVSELNPARSLNTTPLFQVMFLFQNILTPSLNLNGVQVEELRRETDASQFDLECHFWEQGELLHFKLIYNAALFRPESVELIGRSYLNLLAGVVAQPERCIWDFSLMRRAEERQLLAEVCGTPLGKSGLECLHEIFLRHVRTSPDAVALEYMGRQWTYQEIDRESDGVVGLLSSNEISSRNCIAVLLDGGPAQVIALLGILKAGCAFVCISRKDPPLRMRHIIDEVKAPAVIATSEMKATISKLFEGLSEEQPRVLYLPTDPAAQQEIVRNVGEEKFADPTAIAFIAYTSGSTGRPKGIIQTHGNFSQFVTWFGEEFCLERGKRVAQWSAYSHDSAYAETFGALCNGATLCMIEEFRKGDPVDVARWLESERISFFQTVPGFGEQVIQAIRSQEQARKLPRLESMAVAGEILKDGFAADFIRTLGDHAQLHNLYGPTESVLATSYQVKSVEPGRRSIPVGRPIEGRRIVVIDKHGQLCPSGMPGEIYIASAYLSPGYLARPEETRLAFLQNPLHSDYPDIVYRTGDVGRWLPDGNLEFLGRVDWQVKVRGQRVEAAEIESVIASHPGVRECAVVARELDGGLELIAFVSGDPKEIPAQRKLPAAIAASLPDYMVPAISWIEAIPRLPNGKVDRAALLSLPVVLTATTDRQGPRSATEEIVSGIWKRLLQKTEIGVHDNFFDVGGHSLLATRVVVRMREIFHCELPLRDFFEGPSIAELAAFIDQSSGAAEKSVPPILPAPRDGFIPLSFAQQRLWFVQELSPSNGAYNMTSAIRLEGELDVLALEKALSELVRRHETLRTRFDLFAGMPVQQVCSNYQWQLEVLDAAGLSVHGVRSLLSHADQAPFDLKQAPLLRAKLLKLAENDHVLALVVHHIAFDGWSAGILVRELVELYRAFCETREPVLPELKIQYADYAVWQRNWLDGEVLSKEFDYWKQQLAGAPRLELPLDHPRSDLALHPGGILVFEIPGLFSSTLQEFARSENVTLFMLFLAAFKVLLSRYSGQTDILVGSPIAGRNQAELEGLIGFFVNILLLRTDLSGDPGFHELLGQVREVCLQAYAHQEVPFEKLVEELSPDRDLNRNPLYEVLFALHNAPLESAEVAGLKISPFEYERPTTPTDLSCHVREMRDGLMITLNYNTELFEHTTIARIARHLYVLLESVVTKPTARLSEIRLLDEAERKQVLFQSQGTPVNLSSSLLITQQFEKQVRAAPSAVALVCGTQQLTYSELNSKVNQLAHHLIAMGIGPEIPVGLFLERSAEMIIATLAVLKAGGAYVPLDVAYPTERLRYMLENSAVPLVLTTETLSGMLPPVQCVYLDRDWSQISRQSVEDPRSPVDQGNLAYIIYTSGSTGNPKGVCISHRALINHMQWMAGEFQLRPDDSIIQKTSTSFDASVWELFLPFITGTRLVVAGAAAHLDVFQMAADILLHKATHLQIVPSILRLLIREGLLWNCGSLRRICCGGEALSPELVREVWNVLECEIVNLYGPTEATIDAVAWSLPAPTRALDARVPIGRPVANTSAYVLDDQMEPVPVGVVGELYLGGAGLARGYRNRPDLTAERFGPDPFANEPGERLYKTGDLVRWKADSTLEYLGRADNQVKVRGCRIELSEIESALREQAGVQDAAVVVLPADNQEPALVSFVVGDHVDVEFLQSSLAVRLPSYMLPSRFVRLDALPLTPNGKLDRKALLTWKSEDSDNGRPFHAAETEAEKAIAGVWSELLRLDRISIEDNFFDLGGSSLIAVQLLTRLNQIFSADLQVADIFQFSTVSSMARHICGAVPAPESSSSQEAERAGKKRGSVHYWQGKKAVRQQSEHPQPVAVKAENK
jgi:amino acid adenylation domain-containing protein